MVNHYGSDHAEVGDTVCVVDSRREPGWACKLRVMKRVRTYFDGLRTHLVLGRVPAVGYTVNATLGERMAAVEDAAGYASDQSTSNTEVAAAQELNIEELQNAVAVRPTAVQVDDAIATAIAALDDLGGMEF